MTVKQKKIYMNTAMALIIAGFTIHTFCGAIAM